MNFEWDTAKDESNRRKHGIGFSEAAVVFLGLIVATEDTRRDYGERRLVALGEYEASIEDGRFTKPVEYQDSRGFVWQAERMIEGAAAELAKADADAFAKIRRDLAELKTAWPAPMPPEAPILQPGKMSALISDIELHASRY